MGQVIRQLVHMRTYVAGNEVELVVGLNINQGPQQMHDILVLPCLGAKASKYCLIVAVAYHLLLFTNMYCCYYSIPGPRGHPQVKSVGAPSL